MRSALHLLASAAFALPLAAQVTIDEGSFTLYVNGSPVGREQFSIKRSSGPGGVSLLTRATVTLGQRRIESTLRTDSTGQPMEFLLDAYAADRLQTRVRSQVITGRFVQRVLGPAGASAEKEVRLAPGTVIADSEMVHPYYFFGRSRATAWVPVLFPRHLVRDSATVLIRAGTQDVDVGNGTVPARHLMVTDGAGTVTDLWVDADGRLLRVAVQARGFVAKRDEPPR